MTIEHGPYRMDSYSEEQVERGEHIEPHEKVLYSFLVRRVKIPAGLFKKRMIDYRYFVLTEEHVIDIEFDRLLPGYQAIRIPYTAISQADVIGKGAEVMILAEGIGVYTAKVGEQAAAVLEEIQARRSPSA